MNEFTLYDKNGTALIDIVPDESSTHEWSLMSENRLSLTFELDHCVNLSPGCYVDFDGVRYYLLEEYKPQMVNTTAWMYNVDLRDAASWLSVILALNLLDGQNTPIFNYTAPAVEHAQIIVDNLNRSMGTTAWKVGSVISTANITIEYRAKYCSDVLQEIVDDQNTEWWLDGMSLNIGRAEFGDAVELGYGNGLLGDIVCEQADNMRTYAYLCPIGSTRNIDPTKYGYERLQLPDGQTLVPMNTEQGFGELAEEKAFSKIFPRYEGTVQYVRTRSAKGDDGREFTIYYIGTALPFNPNEYEIADLVKQISFLSGQLMGEDFEANYDSEAREFEIITRWPDGGDAQLPGGLLTPEVGDKYVIWNITMPDVYYTLASQEFLEAAEAFAAEAIKDVVVYKAPLDYMEVQERGLRLRPGQRVRLLSDAYFSSGYYDSRITRITRDVLFPDAPRIEVSAVRALGTISRIRQSIQSNEKAIAQVLLSVPDIITSDENTPASDSSVYSSAKSEREFLSKRKGGTVQAPVSFGAEVTTVGFESGMLGKGFGVTTDANGNTVVTTDILRVRKSAEFYELIINQMSFSRGATVHSAAGCEITSVEEIDGVYRCFYDNKDGKRHSGFKVGDQARCQRFDDSFGSVIKYYWRVVAGVGDNYVDLYIAGTDDNGYALVDGDGIPEVGDEIVQMGSRTDKTRQGVIVIASTPEPTILQYDGIDSFVLPAPSTKIAPNDNEFTGRMHIGTGSTGAKNITDLPEVVKEAVGDIELGELSIGNNLLRNSGFTGDYTTSEFTSAAHISGSTKVYSDSLKYWDVSNVVAQASDYSQSGVEVTFENGLLSQKLNDAIIVGDSYIFSVYAKGDTLTFSIAGYSETIALADTYERYVVKFKAASNDATLNILSANATICLPQLERGNVVTAWGLSIYDNDKSLAYYQQLQYLASAIKSGSVDILGGLILANMILLGNYQDGEMKAVTAGISGIYNDSDDVAFWAGGAMEKAITTVRRFRENPRYQPTNAEWADMASFVATHGGDLFLKGYIFALGGFFRGTVSMANGKIQLNEDGSGSLADKSFVWDREGRVMRNYPDIINWIPLPNFTDGVIDHSLGGYFEAYGYDGNNTFNLPNPPFSPYKMVLRGPRVKTRSVFSAYIHIAGDGRFIWGPVVNGGNTYWGKTMVINTNAGQGDIEVVWTGDTFEVNAPVGMLVRGKDDVEEDESVDVQIY